MSELVYEPVESVRAFLMDESFVSIICGPVGSTKTTAGIMKIAYHAKQMAPCRDGKRRSRCMWVRNTKPQLDDTSIPDFLKWFPDQVAGEYAKTERRFLLQFDDVECEVLWRPLETSDDVRRVLSTQLSFAVLEECREINADIFEALQGRLGRYPDGSMVPHKPEWGVDDNGYPIQGCVTDEGAPNKHLWAMTNPPDEDTFWEQYMTNPPSNAKIYFQPSGLSAQADWVHLLPSNYYEDLMQGKSEAYIDVYIHSKFGKSLSGQPVFRAFSSDIHVPPEPLQWARGTTSPLLIGFDCGLNPTAVICQVDYRGRILVLSALTSDGMGALRFCQTVLKPHLATRFAGHSFVVIGDPAGQQRAQTDERSVFDILRAQGLRVIPARTNALAARISAVDNFLTRMVDGVPMILFDKDHSGMLIKAMRGKYRYKLNKNGSMPDAPEKSHPWSDLCFAAGTRISTPSGVVNIEALRAGDYVTTPGGAQRVLAAAQVSSDAEVWEWTFSDGTKFVATPDHPVYVENENGFVSLDTLEYSDILVRISHGEYKCEHAEGVKQTSLPTTRNGFTAARNVFRSALEALRVWSTTGFGSPISRRTNTTGTKVGHMGVGRYTSTCGKNTTGLLRRAMKSITSTVTRATIRWKISKRSMEKSTHDTTCSSASPAARWMSKVVWWRPEKQRSSGMRLMQAGNGTQSTVSERGLVESVLLTLAHIAAETTRLSAAPVSAGSAPLAAKPLRASKVESTTRRVTAPCVPQSSYVTSIRARKHAVRLVGKRRLPSPTAVYTLQIENEPMYFAEGILARNCDSLQYVCLHADGSFLGATGRTKAKEIVKSKWHYS